MSLSNLLRGIVVETSVNSATGRCLYSDFYYQRKEIEGSNGYETKIQDGFLNKWARIPVIGMIAGIARIALAIIHIIGHLFAAICGPRGHLFHAAKGGGELLRGVIELIPIGGRIFANKYSETPPWFPLTSLPPPYESYSWWVIKIYNPLKPDLLDIYAGYWKGFKESRPEGYFSVKLAAC